MTTLRQRRTVTNEKSVIERDSVGYTQKPSESNVAWNTSFSVDFIGLPLVVVFSIYFLIVGCGVLLSVTAYQRFVAHPDQTLLFRLVTMFDTDSEKYKSLRMIFGAINLFMAFLIFPFFVLLLLNTYSHRLRNVTLSAPPTAPKVTKATPRLHLNRLLDTKSSVALCQLMVKTTLLGAAVLEAVCSYHSTQHVLPARMWLHCGKQVITNAIYAATFALVCMFDWGCGRVNNVASVEKMLREAVREQDTSIQVTSVAYFDMHDAKYDAVQQARRHGHDEAGERVGMDENWEGCEDEDDAKEEYSDDVDVDASEDNEAFNAESFAKLVQDISDLTAEVKGSDADKPQSL